MRLFRCPTCDGIALLETLECGSCSQPIGLHPPSLSMRPAEPTGSPYDGQTWVPCSNRSWGCNWLLATDDDASRCISCRMTRRMPDASDTISLEKLAEVAMDKRRLLVQLLELGLPVTPWFEKDGGLGFDLLSSRSNNEKVIIGHANGIVTIDLAETLDDHREALRVRLGEPYRTMLGHFRHEVGHYYQWVLVESTDDPTLLNECREIFGDETTSYSDAIDRHYKVGPPPDWAENFISEYATMHPWEDFAECFAHYLHITGTLGTAASAGLVLQAARVPGVVERDVEPRNDYADASIGEILDDWHWLSLLFNRVNRAMGQDDLYPFDLVEPVMLKLAFVHKVVTVATGRRTL
ncbi:putative zinc-binding metallopeptidase [soil metagenome]